MLGVDAESAAYNLAHMAGAPWRKNVVRSLLIIQNYYSLRF